MPYPFPPQATKPVVVVTALSKRYGPAGRRTQSRSNNESGAYTDALSNVNLTIGDGEFVGIMGPSGSGKSTLLNCIATIDRPSAGSIVIADRELTSLAPKALSRFRRDSLGFIFQDANLLDTLTGFENIALALTIRHAPAKEVKARVRQIATQLSIDDVLDRYPYQMSGGQRQRVAAARATISHPAIILADEPTGALDSRSALQLLRSLEVLNGIGSTILMVTHDAHAASFCDRILLLRDGQIAAELRRNDAPHNDAARLRFYRDICALTAQFDEEADHAC